MARKSKSSAKGRSEKEFAVIGLGHFGASLASYDVSLLLIQRQGRLIPCPGAEIRLEQGDTVFAYSLPYPTDWRTWYAHTVVMSIGDTVHRRTT